MLLIETVKENSCTTMWYANFVLFTVKKAGHQVRGDQSDIVEGFVFDKITEVCKSEEK